MFDDVTGLWKFGSRAPSQQTVDIDPFSECLEKSLHLKDSLINTGPLHSFVPDPDGDCECGVCIFFCCTR